METSSATASRARVLARVDVADIAGCNSAAIQAIGFVVAEASPACVVDADYNYQQAGITGRKDGSGYDLCGLPIACVPIAA